MHPRQSTDRRDKSKLSAARVFTALDRALKRVLIKYLHKISGAVVGVEVILIAGGLSGSTVFFLKLLGPSVRRVIALDMVV
jgi:hypothetical protein